MPNPLTGGFDAVLQVSVRRINGLLATLHQNGASSEHVLKLLHSVRTRVGDVRRRTPDLAAFAEWVLEYQQAGPSDPRQPVRDLLVASSPPGVVKRIETAFKDFDLVLDPTPDLVRGTAALQLSTVRLSVAGGSASEITVHADIRAKYSADPATTPLPEFINGEVRAVYEIRKVVSAARTRLFIRPSAQDQKIEFIPASGSGLSSTDAARVAVEVRKILRAGIIMPPVDLPEGFPFNDFKGVGSGVGEAIALPLQLSNAPAPPGGTQGITQSLIGFSGFAFAVSREHVQSLIDVEAIREAIKERRITFHVSVFGFSGSVTYRLRFTSGPTLTFQPGAIEISGRVAVETGTWWAPNGSVSFKQRITLVLETASQAVNLEALGEPTVNESLFIPHSVAVNAVKSEMAKALSANAPAVRRVFRDARTSLLTSLQTFERSASATYTELDVSTDGVVIRGDLSSAQRIAPVVKIGEIVQGPAFTAFESWIPGGRIDRFDWSWVEYPPSRPIPWMGVVKTSSETARFILEKPAGISEISQICLRLVGSRTLPDGRTQTVTAGTVCELDLPVITFDAPSWWEPVMVPVWRPDLPETARVGDGIVAHISLQTDRPQRESMQNAVVFFPDWSSTTPFDMLVRGIGMMRRKQEILTVFVIVPDGSFDISRREFEARLEAFQASSAVRVQVAEDTEGGWSRTFDVSSTPSVFLMNARREFVTIPTREFEPESVAAALDRYVVTTPGPQFRPLRLNVSVGDFAPDVVFQDDRGDEGALHRLRGRPVLITFWQSWSSPCLAELRRLKGLEHAEGRDAPFILAIYGGAERESFDDVRKEHGLSFAIVNDTEHRIARKFGVRCWPTTIAIDPDGMIEQIQLGIEPDFEDRQKY